MQLIDKGITLLYHFIGHDTTTSGTSWTLYEIARHPDVQHAVYKEISEVLEGRDDDIILWYDI